MRVLWMSYYFPPLGKAGVMRSLKVPRYLERKGVDVWVLTPHPPHYTAYDPSLLKEAPRHVIRTPSFDPLHFLPAFRGGKGRRDFVSFPDNKTGWIPFAVREIKRINPDVLVTSGPPFSVHLAGFFTPSLWIAEFRDAWTLGHFGKYAFSWEERLAEKIERKIVESADACVVVSPHLKRDMERKYRKKIYCIPGGYDEEDFQVEPLKFKEFTIFYMGSTSEKRYIDEEIVFEGVKRSKIPARFLVAGMEGKGEGIEFLGYIPHKDAIRYMLSSDLLIFTSQTERKMKYVVSLKIYEFMRSQKPILYVCPDEELLEIMKGHAIPVESDPEKIGEKIREIYHGKHRFSFKHPKNYSWENVAEKYLELMKKLLHTKTKGGKKGKGYDKEVFKPRRLTSG